MAPYGQSKHAAEGYCALYGRLHGVSTVTLRYANVYGPRQDPHGEGGVVAIFCGKLVEGGRPWRSATGFRRATTPTSRTSWRRTSRRRRLRWVGACNVGTGTETTVLRAGRRAAGLDGSRPFELEYAPERPGEIRRSAVDPSLAREALGWEARVGLARRPAPTLATVRG